jgi:hypothetical protein
MYTLDKSHARLMTFLNTREINSMLDYDTLDIGMLDITASPFLSHGCKLCNFSSALQLAVIP